MKGAIPIEKRTISGRISKKHSLPHNNREFLCENVDPTRTKDNITIIKDDIGQVYHQLFDNALIEYNASESKEKELNDRITMLKTEKKEAVGQLDEDIAEQVNYYCQGGI